MTESTTDPVPPVPPHGPVTPGGLRDRFLARLVDAVLLLVVTVVVVSVVVVGAILGHAPSFYGLADTWVDAAVSAVLSAAITLGYFAVLESREGRTVGKRIMRLRTLGPAGDLPTLAQAVRRNAWTVVTALALVPVASGVLSGVLSGAAAVVAGGIALGINADTVARQGPHDRFAGGTRVVEER